MNLAIEYVDQNDEFGEFFPRNAKAIKTFRSSDSGIDWLLTELEEPFLYGQRNEFGNHTLNNTHLLLAPRLQGSKVSDTSFHAHVLLVKKMPDTTSDAINIDRSNHVAWCIVERRI